MCWISLLLLSFSYKFSLCIHTIFHKVFFSFLVLVLLKTFLIVFNLSIFLLHWMKWKYCNRLWFFKLKFLSRILNYLDFESIGKTVLVSSVQYDRALISFHFIGQFWTKQICEWFNCGVKKSQFYECKTTCFYAKLVLWSVYLFYSFHCIVHRDMGNSNRH